MGPLGVIDRDFFERLREAKIAELLYDLEIEFPQLLLLTDRREIRKEVEPGRAE